MSEYKSPLASRYASRDMLELFSDEHKFKLWRRLWVALAKGEKELGLDITDVQIAELEANVDNLNPEVAREAELKTRHDVMAQVHAYAVQCPAAGGIIHLGATSCYVGDNADILIMRDALRLLRGRVCAVMSRLSDFAMEHRSLPTLGFTHMQPAQPVTVGKRAALWINDLLKDLEELAHRLTTLKMRGVKGTTGTQASFLELFGDGEKVKRLERHVCDSFGFASAESVTGQTYSRKVDAQVLGVLSGIAQSACKFATDLRLLQHLKEVEEPFEEGQVGSSAMAYKRNPMRSERMCGLARHVIAAALNPAMTAATQWMERTLDDSSNRRLAVPEAFLAVDAILNIWHNIAGGMVVYPKVIQRRLEEELPFMATENILMRAVKKGGDRQLLHERIRELSMKAGHAVKAEGERNNLLELIAADPAFNLTEAELSDLLDPSLYIGRAPQQVEEFIGEIVRPAITGGGGIAFDDLKV